MGDSETSTQVQIRMTQLMRDKLQARADAMCISLPSYMKVAAMEKAMREDK